MTYGLIGKTLKHSYSKELHELLASYTYDLIPLQEDEFDTFMKEAPFDAINVTIPYKKAVIPYLDNMDEHAKAIGAVNTIVSKQGKLIGYNTDYYGFLYMIQKHHVEIKNKKVLILGSGGACAACKAVITSLNPKELYIVGRAKKQGVITYEECYNFHTDASIIINTTPVGMYPNVDDVPIDLAKFIHCEYVLDVIYNPLQTRLCFQAKQLNIPYVSGLEMLVAQAKQAVEHFLDTTISDDKIEELYQRLYNQHCNFVLIGMPSSGKTTIGKMLSKQWNKAFIDTDEEIIKHTGMSIPSIFEKYHEEGFRNYETEVIKGLSSVHNSIIATGGGSILSQENMRSLAQNGIIIYIDRDVDKLISKDENRPLSSSKERVAKLYQQREPLYRQYADLIVSNNQTIEQCILDLQHKLENNYFNHLKGRD